MNDLNLNSKTPTGDLHTAWTRHKDFLEKLSKEEANKYKIIIIGTGLAGTFDQEKKMFTGWPKQV